VTLYKAVSQGLLKVGDKIKLNNGAVLLVGDVNELGGVCDDCRPYDDYEVVEINGEPVQEAK
jgi:hypothetical protein